MAPKSAVKFLDLISIQNFSPSLVPNVGSDLVSITELH